MGTDPTASAAPISPREHHHPRRAHVNSKKDTLDKVDQWFVLGWEPNHPCRHSGWSARGRQLGKEFAFSVDLGQQLEIPAHEKSPAVMCSKPNNPVVVPNTLREKNPRFVLAQGPRS